MEKAIVLYCDILGFTKLINLSDGADNSETLAILRQALSESLKILQDFTTNPKINFYKESYDKINYKIFSDNLYVSISYNPDIKEDLSNCFWLLLLIARVYQETMLRNRVLIRGGISFGDDFIEKDIIFSPALIKAYKIENEIAIYPRIVIDDDIIDKIKDGSILPNIYSIGIDTSIIGDWTKTYFVNPVNVMAETYTSKENIAKIKLATIESQEMILNFILTQVASPQVQETRNIFEKNLWMYELITWLMYKYYSEKDENNSSLGFNFLIISNNSPAYHKL